MGLLLMMMSCVTSLSVVILFTIQGVRSEVWSVTYQSKNTCAFVGSSVDMSCSYTYPSGLSIRQVYWTKHNYTDPPDLHADPDYRNRVTVFHSSQYVAKRYHLHIKALTKSDSCKYYCRIISNSEGQNWIGTPGIYLDVKDAPQTSVSISPPGDIQEGTDVTLTCTSASDLPVRSYSWHKSYNPIDMESGKTYTIKHITPEDSGPYYCVSEYECGLSYSSTVQLQVSHRPKNSVVVIEPPGQIIVGSTVTLTCSTDANPPAHDYRWYKNGMNTHSSNRQTLSFSHVRYEERGEYSCQATNNYGSAASPYTSLRVLYPPKNTRIESNPSGEMIEGSTVTLTCMSEADPPVQTYTWIKKSGAVELKSGKEKTLIISKIRLEDRGEYMCQAANMIGQQASPAVPLKVIYTPKNTSVSVRPDVITKGSSVNLTCSSDANPPVEIYTWFKVGESTPVGSGQQYRSEDGGQYYCEARNKYGAGNSSIVSVIVEGDQSPLLIAVVAVSVCGLVCLLCAFVGVKKMKMRRKAEEQRSSIKLQSRGGAEDDFQYSTNQPHGSRETAGGAEDDVLYSTIQPHDAGETAGAQGDDVQYSSVQLKKGGAVYGSPNQPEGELSVIYSSVETKA